MATGEQARLAVELEHFAVRRNEWLAKQPGKYVVIKESNVRELAHPLIECLLGRDVLSRWRFTYDGPTGSWQIKEEAVGLWVEPPEGIDLWGE